MEGFFDYLPDAPSRILALDFDGTLAPFRTDRDSVFPYPGIRGSLAEIIATGRTRVVIVSGREVEDLARVLGLDPAPEMWGCHGWEHLDETGAHRRRKVSPAAEATLQQVLTALAPLDLRDRLERKHGSLAVHLRDLNGDQEARIRGAVESAFAAVSSEAVRGHAFDGGLELRVDGWDKGGAVRSMLASEPAGAAVAYLGDDLTDEDAFRALQDAATGGRAVALTALVRPQPRPTHAMHRLVPPQQVLDFLRRWRSAAG